MRIESMWTLTCSDECLKSGTFQQYVGIGLISYLLQSIALNNGTDAMKVWENLPTPLEFRIFVFNVTNPEAVTAGERPILQELGPYIYK